jgi:hypothetical protein
MSGLITGRDVLRHPVIIVRAWGALAYVRCLRTLVSRKPATFLSVAVAPHAER